MRKCYITNETVCDHVVGIMDGSVLFKHEDNSMYFSVVGTELKAHDIDAEDYDPFEDGKFEDAIIGYYGDSYQFLGMMQAFEREGHTLTLTSRDGTHKCTLAEIESTWKFEGPIDVPNTGAL